MSTLPELLANQATVNELSKEELVNMHNEAKYFIEELTAAQNEIRAQLLEKIDVNGEIIGDSQVLRAEKLIINTTVEQAEEYAAVKEEVDAEKVSLEVARGLGAVKRIVDATLLRKMVRKGAEVPGIVRQNYIIIKQVTKTKDVETATTT
jgi:hypothetical protein